MNKVIGLTVTNYKRIQAIEIHPDGNQVIIGGDNAQGKTSILDSIQVGLGGKNKDAKPIRDGEDSAQIVVELEDLVVTRRFTASGTRLTVESKDGAVYKSPQAMLDKLIGTLSFDPLAFSQMDGKEQAAALREAMGVDTTDLDIERSRVFEERTGVNRTVKSLKSSMDAMPYHEDVPDEPVDTSKLWARMDQAAQVESDRKAAWAEADRLDNHVQSIRKRQDELARELELAEKERADAKAVAEKQDAVECESVDELREQIQQADAIKSKQQENLAHKATQKGYIEEKAKSEKLTARLKEIDDERLAMMESAKYPIDGISIDQDGRVVYQGIPFSQASAAERIRVGAAMALAMNPELGVILIRDGSLMDAKTMAALHEFVAENDAQVWIERVGDADTNAIVIEDGALKE